MFSQCAKHIQFAITIASAVAMTVACGKADRLDPLASSTIGGPPATMKVKINNYVPQSGKAFQHLFVSNFSVKAKQSRLYKSYARDGLFDDQKIALNRNYGFLTAEPESVVPGFADIVLFNLGIVSAQQPLMYCSTAQYDSTSNDAFIYTDSRLGRQIFLGLRDCQKNYLGLNPNRWNNAGDGIPDYLKIRCGLNPANRYDAFISSAGDGVPNIEKCKQNIPVDEDSRTDANRAFAYQYDIRTLPDGSAEFEVSNIPILDEGRDTFLAFYVTEIDLADRSLSLYTAYAILPGDFVGKTLEFDYWALPAQPNTFFNQRIGVTP